MPALSLRLGIGDAGFNIRVCSCGVSFPLLKVIGALERQSLSANSGPFVGQLLATCQPTVHSHRFMRGIGRC